VPPAKADIDKIAAKPIPIPAREKYHLMVCSPVTLFFCLSKILQCVGFTPLKPAALSNRLQLLSSTTHKVKSAASASSLGQDFHRACGANFA
jgi:hypothetical protein